MRPRILVIGGAGHIGNALVRSFLDENCQVTAVGRRLERPLNLSGLPVNYRSGDGDNAGQFQAWANGHDIVVDAAAPYPLNAFSPWMRNGNVIVEAERRTEWLSSAVLNAGARLVYVSSFVTCLRPATGLDQLRAQLSRLVHPYFEVKQLIESRIMDAARRGLRAVIVNPTYCLGPWDLRDRRLCTIPLLLRGEMTVSVHQRLNVIDVRDVAAAAIRALQLDRYGEPLLLRGHDIEMPTLYSRICELGGRGSLGYALPAGIAAVGAYGLDLLLGLAGESSLFASGPILLATMFDDLSSSGELKTLGISVRPLYDTLRDSIAWYRQIGYC